MADYAAVAAAGLSLERLLSAAFLDSPVPVPGKTTKAVLSRTEDFDTTTHGSTIVAPALSIFVYRVDYNRTMRAAWSAVGSNDGRGHLPLDLHILLTPWAENAEHELRILGRAMETLEALPILTGPLLSPSAAWAANDGMQVVLEDMSTETLMRIFDSLESDYKLSVPYIARVVRVDTAPVAQPRVTTAIAGATPSPEP